MTGRKKQEWVEKGYLSVAENGFESLTVNNICRMVAKSKSSFYHFFGELELFKDALMVYHLERAYGFANKITGCENIHPDLIEVLMDYKMDIFFYKQFRIYRDKSTYEKYNQKIFDLYENAILDKLADYFELKNRKIFVRKFHKFLTEHFLMSISLNTYTYDWVENYILEVLEMVRLMKKVN